MNASRLARCLRLLNLLQARLSTTVEGLARECGVSKRTIYRDFRLLAEAGVALHYDQEAKGHVVLTRCYPDVTRGFTKDELATFILAARTSYLQQVDAIRGSVNQSISKILASMPAQKREEILRSLRAFSVALPRPDADQKILLAVLSAIRQDRQLRITFVPSPESNTCLQTRIGPCRLTINNRGCEVIARSSLHRQVRAFSLSQIQTAEVVEDTHLPLPLRDVDNQHIIDRRYAPDHVPFTLPSSGDTPPPREKRASCCGSAK